MNTFLIVDGLSIAYRAFHVMTKKLTAPDGTPTSMITGFMNMLLRAQDDLSPDCTVIVFDTSGKNASGIHVFRYDLQENYKAGRKPMDDEMKGQLPILQELLQYLGYRVIVGEGVEADDAAASIARLAQKNGDEAMILTSDKDLFQMLGDGISMMRPVKNGISGAEIYDAKKFTDEFGFPPSSMADYLALAGDKSDKIEGVKGIGEKGAAKLLAEYPTIEEIFASLDKLKKGTRAKLEAVGLEKILWTRNNIIRLKEDIFSDDADFLNDCLNFPQNFPKAESMCVRLGLERLLKRIGSTKHAAPRVVADPSKSALPPADILTGDYKTELKHSPETFTGSPIVWDLHTAYYLLHPDEAGRTFASLLDYLRSTANPAQTLAELAGQLHAEILQHEGLADLMNNIDLPLIPVLNKMEEHGVRISPADFAALRLELEGRTVQLEAKLIDETGLRINMNSPQQVGWLLFERLDFTPTAKTKAGSPSVDAAVLGELAKTPGKKGDVPRILLEYRELSKMLAGFVVPFMRAADGDHIIRTTFEPAATGTGRLSSRDPNMQNIPAFGEWADKIKRGIVPVHEGNIFVGADYSQVELRVFAHMSGEERLLDAFAHNRDIHTETASWVFGVMPELVTPELRRTAKMINFGLLYGMSEFGLADRLGVSRAEAKDIMRRYFAALPGLKGFLAGMVEDAKARGYSRTLFGRIRPVDGIPAKFQALDRALINSPIQGTAADIARRAMVAVERELAGRMFLQVHDSIVCECSEGEADEVAHTLQAVMKASGGEVDNLETEIKRGCTLADV